MPQMFSRMDDSSWLTPSMADILDQGAAPPGGDGSIREQMLQVQKELNDLGTPARIVNYRPTPAYTLYVAKPDTIGRLGNRRAITPNEIRRSIGKIAEQHKEWTLGFLPQLQESPEAVGILIRTDQHQVLSLRRQLVRSAFRNHPSMMAVTMGNTIEQQLLVTDLNETGHLLVVGKDRAKQHFLRAVLLTLILLNTPGELRLALGGESSETYKPLINIPHALGRLLTSPEDGQRLLDGLIKEVQRRQNWFDEGKVETLDDYNSLLKEQGQNPIPRIGLMIDSLSDASWKSAAEHWAPTMVRLLKDGRTTGIYLILAVDQIEDLPNDLQDLLTTQIFMRSASSNLTVQMENFHGSLLRFIDAFVTGNGESGITPVELCAVSNEEVYRAVTYWRAAAKQRYQEAQLREVSGKTGVTDVLRPRETQEVKPPTPPVPEKPTTDTLLKATQVLATPEDGKISETMSRSIALAAYLGWLGIGPLEDILGMSHAEARNTLSMLQELGIVEQAEVPTPRFLRLQQNPLDAEGNVEESEV